MQITHIIPGDLWAGAESQVYYTISQFVRSERHDVSIILFNEGELYHRLSRENITIYIIDESVYGDVTICKMIMNILKELNPDIIHAHEYKSHILSMIAKLLSANQCKIVRTYHGQTVTPFKIKPLAISFLEKIVLRFCTDRIIAVSKDIQSEFRKKYPEARVSLISNAIPPYADNKQESNIVRSRYGIGQDILWIGTAVRLVEIKNIDMLIDAAEELRQCSGKEFRVSIFGEGPLEGRLKKKVEAYHLDDNVILHGQCNNIYPVFKALDIFVLTSLNEGLPMSLLESMSVGTVPVCTSVGGIPEVIEDEVNGFLVDSNNASQLADVLLRLNNNRDIVSNMGILAQNDVLKRFSLDKAVSTLSKLYESLQLHT